MENVPRESGIWAARHPSSYKSFISVIDKQQTGKLAIGEIR